MKVSRWYAVVEMGKFHCAVEELAKCILVQDQVEEAIDAS